MHQITSLASHVSLWHIGQNLCICACLRYLSAMLATSLPILDHTNSHATYAKKLSTGQLLECAAIHATNGSTGRAWAWTHVSTKVLHQTTYHGNAAAAACPTYLHHSLTLPYRNTLTPFRYSHLARQASSIVELESQLQCHPPVANTRTSNPKRIQTHTLTVIVTKCRSLVNTKAELINLLDSTKADIAICTETWLNSTISDSEICPDNYSLFRNDSTDRHGGGVHKKTTLASG